MDSQVKNRRLDGYVDKGVGLTKVFRSEMRLALPIDQVFEFFADAANLERITPPFLRFQFITPLPIEMGVGTRIEYRIVLYGVPMRWKTHITRWEPPHVFTDDQERGPYAQWTHTHRFRSDGADTVIEDEVLYRLPLGYLGLIASPIVQRQIGEIFTYRELAIRRAMV